MQRNSFLMYILSCLFFGIHLTVGQERNVLFSSSVCLVVFEKLSIKLTLTLTLKGLIGSFSFVKVKLTCSVLPVLLSTTECSTFEELYVIFRKKIHTCFSKSSVQISISAPQHELLFATMHSLLKSTATGF